MDFELLKTFYLEKKVLNPCGYEKLLNPRIENGGFINMSIPELRKGLENCFAETDNIIIQEYFIEHLEDDLLFIRYDFEQDKNKLALLKNDKKHLELSKELYVSDELMFLTYLIEYKKMMFQTVNKWIEEKRHYIDNFEEIKKEQAKEQLRKQEESNNKENKKLLKNIYPYIFKNNQAYTIFTEYMKGIEKSKNINYSFLYRVMKEEDKLIVETVKPANFRDFINEHYDIKGGIDKIDTIHKIGNIKGKRKIYNYIKEKYIKS